MAGYEKDIVNLFPNGLFTPEAVFARTTGTPAAIPGVLSSAGAALGGLAVTALLGKIIGGFREPFGVGATTEADLKKQVDEWVASQNKPVRENIPDPGYVLSGPVTTTYDIPGYGKVTGYPSTGGAVLTDVGMYDPNSGQVFGTPPMSPLPEPQAKSVSGGGGGSSSSGGNSGGEVGLLEPDPDLILGSIPPLDGGAVPPQDVFGPIQTQTGTMPAPGPDGKPDPNLPPVEETTNTPTRTKEEWASIVKDWLIRFPNASDAEKKAAITKYGVPADVISQVEAPVGGGTGGTGVTGGTGGTGSGGTGGQSGGATTTPTPILVPAPIPADKPPVQYTGDPGRGSRVTIEGTGIGSGTGTGTGTGTGGTGTGTGGGSGGGLLFGQNQRRTSELVFPELYKNEQKFTLLQNLLSYRPGA